MNRIFFALTLTLAVLAFDPIYAAFNSTTVNGDVIVTDTKLGLIWQKTYVSSKTWQQALDYCENLTYAGYFDWRLPNKNELISLINYEISRSPRSFFPDMPNSSFWSSSTYVYDTNNAWYVSPNGTVNHYSKTIFFDVRCVRNAD